MKCRQIQANREEGGREREREGERERGSPFSRANDELLVISSQNEVCLSSPLEERRMRSQNKQKCLSSSKELSIMSLSQITGNECSKHLRG